MESSGKLRVTSRWAIAPMRCARVVMLDQNHNARHKKTLTVVPISALRRPIKISSMLVRDERYPVCGPADPNNRPSSRNTAPELDPHRSSRWQQSFHLSVSTGR
jgi:hypothetical protein